MTDNLPRPKVIEYIDRALKQDRRDVTRSFVKCLDAWIVSEVNDQEVCYFKNKLQDHQLALLL